MQAQIPHLVVVDGSALQLELAVAAEIEASEAATGPIPTRCVALDLNGEMAGEVIVWVRDGYLSGLEYAWFSDEMPSGFPPVQHLSQA